MSALHDAIHRLNGTDPVTLEAIEPSRFESLAGQVLDVTTPLPDVTGAGWLDLRGAKINCAPVAGWLFTLRGNDFQIDGGTYSGARVNLFNFMGVQCCVSNVLIEDVGIIANWGGPNRASRNSIENVKGSSLSTSVLFDLSSASNARLANVNINTNASLSAFIRIAPGSAGDQFVDTVMMDRIGCQCSGNFRADYGLLINTKYGKLVNCWLSDSYLDHTRLAGIKLTAPPSGQVGLMRNVKITNIRQDADTGVNVEASTSGPRFSDIEIVNPHFHARNSQNIKVGANTNVAVRWPHTILTG